MAFVKMFSGIFDEDGFCDPIFRIGLRVFKKHPVESRQPRPHPDIIGERCGRDILGPHCSRYFSGILAFLDGGAFVVFFFSFCQSKLDLHEVSLSINPKRDECQAVRSDLPYEALCFTPPYEEVTRARRLIASGVACVDIEGDEGIGQHQVAPADRHKAPLEAHMPGFDRFHFVPQERNARLDRFEEFIVKPCTFIDGDGGHRSALVVYSSTKTYLGKVWTGFFCLLYISINLTLT